MTKLYKVLKQDGTVYHHGGDAWAASDATDAWAAWGASGGEGSED